jgi:hypothetical protein
MFPNSLSKRFGEQPNPITEHSCAYLNYFKLTYTILNNQIRPHEIRINYIYNQVTHDIFIAHKVIKNLNFK